MPLSYPELLIQIRALRRHAQTQRDAIAFQVLCKARAAASAYRMGIEQLLGTESTPAGPSRAAPDATPQAADGCGPRSGTGRD